MSPNLNGVLDTRDTDALDEDAPVQFQGGSNYSHRRHKIRQHELVEITSQLAIMARSGVDLSTALRSIAKQSKRPSVAKILTDVHDQVTSGKSFSAALKSHERTFGATYVAMVSAAEASGKMATVLMQLSKLLRGELRLVRSIRSMISYPNQIVVC